MSTLLTIILVAIVVGFLYRAMKLLSETCIVQFLANCGLIFILSHRFYLFS